MWIGFGMIFVNLCVAPARITQISYSFYKRFMKTYVITLLVGLACWLNLTSVSAQDNAIDLAYVYRTYKPIFKNDVNADLSLSGPAIGYSGYLGIMRALEFRAGYITSTYKPEQLQGGELESSGVHFAFLTKAYVNEEVNGFVLGYGGEINVTKEVFVYGATIDVGYRLLISDVIGIEPSVIGTLGNVFAREELLDSYISFGYGFNLRVGYIF